MIPTRCPLTPPSVAPFKIGSTPGIPLPLPDSFTTATFSIDGMLEATEQIAVDALNSTSVQFFEEKFKRLTGDVELPFEGRLPEGGEAIEFRICSDLNEAYVLYYLGDEIISASLLLSGNDETAESELAQVFKFLLLDTHDEEDPTEEEIDAVLSRDEFNFFAIQDRPVVFQIQFAFEPELTDTCLQVMDLDRHLAAAFFGIDRPETDL